METKMLIWQEINTFVVKQETSIKQQVNFLFSILTSLARSRQNIVQNNIILSLFFTGCRSWWAGTSVGACDCFPMGFRHSARCCRKDLQCSALGDTVHALLS
jgi:hypothetical protein